MTVDGRTLAGRGSDQVTHADDCPPALAWGSLAFAAARRATGAEPGPEPATVVLARAPAGLSPELGVRELLSAGREFFGNSALDDPVDLGVGGSRAELAARTRGQCAATGRPIVLVFGAADGARYLGAALVHGRFDATAGWLFEQAIEARFEQSGRQPTEAAADPGAPVAASQRSLAGWRRTLAAVGGVSRVEPSASAPNAAYLRLPSRAGHPDGPTDGLAPVLDAIGQLWPRGDGARLVCVTGSNRQYPDLDGFAGMAAQPGPVLLDEAATDPRPPTATRCELLRRRLLVALRSARWCPRCLDAELDRFDTDLVDLFAGTLVVNDLRQLRIEFADVLDRVPAGRPIELPDWPFHPGGSALALVTDASGAEILALRSTARTLSGIEPADFLERLSTILRPR